MAVSCPYCTKRIFQVTLRRIYQLHRDVDPAVEKWVREEIEEARCASCGRILPQVLWEELRPQT